MKRFINYFIPEKYLSDKELNRKSKFAIWFLFMAMLITTFFSIIIFLERPDDVINILAAPVFLVMIFFNLWIFKRTGAFLLLTHILGGFFILGMAAMPSETGGIFSPDMPTIYIIPIFALIMGNLLAGLLYAFLMYAVIFAYYFADLNATMDFRGQTEEIPSDYYLFNLVLNALVILFLVFRNEVLRLKGVAELRKSNELIAFKNKEITDSINYARRIQNAILPQKEYLEKILPEAFFLYKPKDIVSGDFYWVSEKNGFLLIAVADCTGHGVPGAFMSVIGVNHLNEIINQRGITDVSAILDELNKGIVSSLQQRQTETNDGMDIALVKLAKDKTWLEYGGANRSLIHMRAGVLQEYKPSKFPIGGFNSLREKHFVTTRIDLQKGDRFYLSTDGFADQFGSAKNKKMTTKNFKRLLEQSSGSLLPEQEKHLEKFFLDWKTGYEQTDDVLVAGVGV